MNFSLLLHTITSVSICGFIVFISSGIFLQASPIEETTQEINTVIDECLDRLVEEDRFSGTVLVAKDGVPIYKRAVGEACKRYGVPNRVDTKFNLGSMNKMFTGVAIAQLVQGGKLSYDDYVGAHLPDYPNREVREKVTIHHLLTHTSGMGLYWMEFFQNPQWAQLKTVKDFDDLTNTKPLDFEPGERFQYSNCGPLVLGLIIERISGMSYHDYIRSHVTEPAGMIDTECYEMDEPVPNLAIGYTKMNIFGGQYESWHNNLFANPTKGCPAGGGYSTVEDLLRFDIALRNYKLLDKKHFEILTKGKVVEALPTMTGEIKKDLNRKYAYLFQERIVNGQRIIGHSGGAAGIHSHLAMYMNAGYTVAVMSNYDLGAKPVIEKIEAFLTGE
ncbi:MAG: beta-lactamase family protein [Gemmatimonadota bacterium]|nr:MAG: beta-lactamase family protein [Gemmatimonadota bacterium]